MPVLYLRKWRHREVSTFPIGRPVHLPLINLTSLLAPWIKTLGNIQYDLLTFSNLKAKHLGSMGENP